MIPGLPDDLVQNWIIPRLPWFTRPVTPKKWYKALEHPLHYAEQTREVTFVRYHTLGTLIIYASPAQIIMYDDEDKLSIVRLPPVHPPQCFVTFPWVTVQKALVCAGKVFLILIVPASRMVSHPACRFIFELDIGAGLWTWQSIEIHKLRPELKVEIHMSISSAKDFLVFVLGKGDALHAFNARDGTWTTQTNLLPQPSFTFDGILGFPHTIQGLSTVDKLLLLLVNSYLIGNHKQLVLLDIEDREFIRVIEVPDQEHNRPGLTCPHPVLLNEHTIFLFYQQYLSLRGEMYATVMWVARCDLNPIQWSRLRVVMPCHELVVLTSSIVVDQTRLSWYGTGYFTSGSEARRESYWLLRGRVDEEQRCFVWEHTGITVQRKGSSPILSCF